MKKNKLLSILLAFSLLLSYVSVVPGMVAGAADSASPFDIDFEDSALGTFDSSAESNSIQYWTGSNLKGVTQTVKEESGNRYLNLDLTDEAIQSTFTFYPVNWTADLSQDKYSESTFRFRMSDLTKSVDETGYPYLAATISFTDGSSPQSHGVFAISEDGKSIVAYDWSARIYQDGVQKNRLDSLYQAETSLADQWITLKMVNNFETGELTCQLYGENNNLLTEFVQKFDTDMKGRYLYNICFGLYTYYNGVYRRMNLDLDDFAYAGSEKAPGGTVTPPETEDPASEKPFDIDFEDSALGTFDPSGESNAIQYWANSSAAGTAAKTIKEEEGNRYLSIDGTDEAVTNGSLLYLINWNADLTQDKFSKASFRFRMSDMTKSEDETKRPYFSVTAGYYSTAEKKLSSPAFFAVSEDGKSIVAYDGENRIYQNGQQVKYMEPLYTAETTLADQWLTVTMQHNFDMGEMTCTISDEDGKVLTEFVQEFGALMTERYLYCISPYATFVHSDGSIRRMTLDIDDVSYEKITAEDMGMIPAEKCMSELYVSLDGSDENDGTKEAPFATLEKARDTIRAYEALPEGGVTVLVRGGTYPVTETFTLNAKDSGTKENPITYRAYPGEKVVFDGGKTLDFEKFSPVSGEMKDKLISADAQNNVLVADLSEFGIDEVEKYAITNNHTVINSPFIVYDGTPMTLSRWPNSTELSDWPIANGLREGFVEREQTGEGTFLVQYFTDRPDSWSHNDLEDIMAMGYWKWDWYSEAQYVTIDRKEKTLEAHEASMYGVIGPHWVSKDRGFYFLNVYEELDAPGEYYIDRKTNKIYLYPATSTNNPEITMTWANCDFVRASGTSNVTFEGFTFTGGKQYGMTVTGGENFVIDRCEFKMFDKKAVQMTDVISSGVKNSELYYLGQGGVDLDSGDETTLTPGNSFYTNNLSHDFSLLMQVNAYALKLTGVGNKVDHNEFYHCPNIVIRFYGSENVFEYNVFHDVATNSADVGVIYNGRTLTDIDNIIRYNYFYNVGAKNNLRFTAHAIFSDDGGSEMEIYGNVFGEGISYASAIKAHGGMNVNVTNNLFMDCYIAYQICDWGIEKWQGYIEQGSSYFGSSFNLAQTKTYTSRKPWLANLANGGKDFVPDTHTFENNVIMYLNENPDDYITVWNQRLKVSDIRGVDNNLVLKTSTDHKNEFVNYEEGDLTLKDTSVVYSQLPEFKEIPFSEIGRYVVSDEMMMAEVEKAKVVLEGAAEGTGLGEYPKSAIDSFKAAIAAAEQACSEAESEDELTKAVKDLNKAKETFEASVVRSVTVEGQGTVSVPIGFEGAEIHTGELTGDVLLQINGGESNGITVDGTVDGKAVTVEIPDKTAISDGTFMGMGLPSQEQTDMIIGDIDRGVVVGNETEYEAPIRVVLKGAAGQETALLQGDTLYTAVKLKEDSAEALGENKLGVYTSGNDLVVYTTLGGALYAYLPLDVADILKLKSISLDGTPLSGFSPNVTQYTKVLTGNTAPVVSAEASYEKATVEIKQATKIPGNASVIVTAPGTDRKKLYIISFTESEGGTGTGVVVTPNYGTGSSVGGTGFAGSSQNRNEEKSDSVTPSQFTDIISHWAEADINEMAEKGIVSGVTAATFEPDRSITRAEFAALMTRALNLTAANDDAAFSDVSRDAWYADEVAAAAAAGLIVGYDGNFRPDDTITREEMAVVIMKAYTFLGKSPLTGQIGKFADQDTISQWALDYVDKAVSSGLISGMTSDTFAPRENATRAQVTSLIKRLLNN